MRKYTLWLCLFFSNICFVTTVFGSKQYKPETVSSSNTEVIPSCMKCDSLFEKAKEYANTSAIDSALVYLKKTSNSCSCNIETHIKALILQGDMYRQLAEYDKALVHYQKANTLANLHDYKFYFYNSSFKKYEIHISLQNSHIAKDFYQQTLQQDDLPDYVKYSCYESLSLVYLHGVHKDYDQALMWAYKALHFERNLEEKINNPHLYLAMSELYSKREMADSVIKYINKAKILSNKKTISPCLTSDCLLAETNYLSIFKQDFKNAKDSLEKASQIALKYNCFEQKIKVLERYSAMDAKDKNYKEAYKKLTTAQLLSDSNAINKKRINVEKTDDDIKMKLTNLIHRNEAQEERLFQIFKRSQLVIVLFTLLISLVVFTFLQARKIEEKNQKLISITKSRVKESIQNKQTLSIDKLENIRLDNYDDSESDHEENKIPLSNELIVELSEKLNALVQEKFYLNAEITINNLARDLGTNRYYLSQIIQLQYKTNFNHFLNELRVKEIIILFEQNENQKYTLEGLSQQVGFNSVSTFSRAFKRYTGLSPRVYLSNMNKL